MTALGPGVNIAVGNSFTVDVDFTAADTAYQGYKGYLEWNNTIVNDASPPVYTYSTLGGMIVPATPTEKPDGLQFSAMNPIATSNALGTAFTLELTCLMAGTSPLHLVTVVEDAAFGNTHLAPGGLAINTDLVDDSVTCEAAG